MSRHLNEPVKVTQLAKMVNLSSSYFWALFKQKTGYAPVDFLIRLRMHQASRLLKTTYMPVKKIAAVLGYKDPLYFSRVFKSIHRVAPTHYRANSNATILLSKMRPGDCSKNQTPNIFETSAADMSPA